MIVYQTQLLFQQWVIKMKLKNTILENYKSEQVEISLKLTSNFEDKIVTYKTRSKINPQSSEFYLAQQQQFSNSDSVVAIGKSKLNKPHIISGENKP